MNDSKKDVINVDNLLGDAQSLPMKIDSMARLLKMASATDYCNLSLEIADIEAATDSICELAEVARWRAEDAARRVSLSYDGIKRMALKQANIKEPSSMYKVGLRVIYPNGSWKEPLHEEHMDSDYIVILNAHDGTLKVEQKKEEVAS